MSKRPNILITIADDQRGTAVGCGGIEPVRTPHLDALALRGIRFSQAYHHGSCHGAVCSPSRAMLHTGLPYPRLDPAMLMPIYPPEGYSVNVPPMLGTKLRQAGYYAFAAGKWHNGIHSFQKSFDNARNVFFGGMADHLFTPVYDYDPSGRYAPAAARTGEGFSTELFGQAAIDFIRSRKGNDQPFFCYCAFTAPHDPRTPPDAYRRMYDPRAMTLPPNFQPEHPFDTGHIGGRDENLLGHPRDFKEILRSTAEYYGMISHMDEWIGRLHAALAEIGQLENTLVVHTADHGLSLGQHGLMGKQNVYEHSVRVPLIAAGPGLPTSTVRDGLCYQHDLHPTLLELTGTPAGDVHFQSLVPLAHGRSPGRETITSHCEQRQRMVRDRRFKLIEYTVKNAKREQLFDLQNDPWEQTDLIADKAHAATAAALRAKLPTEHLGFEWPHPNLRPK